VFFERKNLKEDEFHAKEFNKPIILIGSHRTGQSIAFNLPKEDLLIDKVDLNRLWILRKVLAPMNVVDAMEFLMDKVEKSKTNIDFLKSMNG
jgi:hypothetical protein